MKELKKSTRREPVSRKKNTAEKKEQTAKKSTKQKRYRKRYLEVSDKRAGI